MEGVLLYGVDMRMRREGGGRQGRRWEWVGSSDAQDIETSLQNMHDGSGGRFHGGGRVWRRMEQ